MSRQNQPRKKENIMDNPADWILFAIVFGAFIGAVYYAYKEEGDQ